MTKLKTETLSLSIEILENLQHIVDLLSDITEVEYAGVVQYDKPIKELCCNQSMASPDIKPLIFLYTQPCSSLQP